MEQIKKGYKRTECGFIPDDWNCIQISSLLNQNIITGHIDGNHGELYPRSNEFTSFGIPYITANDLKEGKICYKRMRYLPLSRAQKFQKGFAINGDVLFAHNATVGPVSLLETSLKFVIISTTVTYFRTDNINLLNSYLLFFLQSQLFVKQYSSVMRQSTRNQIPITTQRLFYINFPKKFTEQSVIAEALSDINELISQTEKLIEKKKAIKQGAMQELLTPPHKGGKRLEGFCGDWEEMKLGDIGFTYGGLSGKTKVDFLNGQFPYITFLNVLNNVVIDKNEFGLVSLKKNEIQNKAQKGDLFFNTSSETPEQVGMCAVLQDDIPNLYLNSFCFGFRLSRDSIDGLFLSYFFNSGEGRKHFNSLAQGATRYNLSKSNFNQIRIYLPKVDEQNAISSILNDLDSVISKLNSKLIKLNDFKHGMMQELLTGKTRLI